jgi:hypothetical protein
MRRDVTPEEAGSSPAGHPSNTPYCDPRPPRVAQYGTERLWPNWKRRLA